MRISSIAPVALIAAVVATTAHAQSGRIAGRYFEIINATYDSVTSLAVADAGGSDFHDVALGEPLRGGVTAITIDLPHGGCVRDLRVTFNDGRRLLYPAIDVCRHRALRLRAADGRRG